MIEQFVRAAETLTADSVETLGAFYSKDCAFTDPFQTVHGREAVIGVYREMFANLHQPQFRNVRILGAPKAKTQGQEMVIAWEFSFSLSETKPRQNIPGCSLLQIDENLQIVRHFDYWDASALMQALPIVGPVVAFVRRKIAGNHKA
jgi:steroid Delta-isomerase